MYNIIAGFFDDGFDDFGGGYGMNRSGNMRGGGMGMCKSFIIWTLSSFDGKGLLTKNMHKMKMTIFISSNVGISVQQIKTCVFPNHQEINVIC